MPDRKPNPIDAHVGSRVRLRRMMVGLSQTELGKQVGITFQQIQKYENGKNRIGASRLHRIATVLSVPVAFFYESAPGQTDGANSDGASNSTSHMLDFLSSHEGLELNRAFARIADPRLRQTIVDLVCSIADENKAE